MSPYSLAWMLGQTMRATIHVPAILYPVPNNLASTPLADRRQGLNGTFKAIKPMGGVSAPDFQDLFGFVSADFTMVHDEFSILDPRATWLDSPQGSAGAINRLGVDLFLYLTFPS